MTTSADERPDVPTLLVVDDRADNRYVLAELLAAGVPGARVLQAASAAEALVLARAEPVDAAVVDVQMPGTDGIDLCRQLKAEPATAPIPLLLITAHASSPRLRAEGLEAGAEDFVSRPLDNAEFLARVRVLLRVRRAEEALRRELARTESAAAFLGRVLEESRNEVYVFAADTLCLLRVNRAARENLGYSADQLLALTPLDLKSDLTPAAFAELVQPLRKGLTDQVRFTTVNRRRDGSRYPVEVHLTLATWEERPVFVALILDTTQRDEAQARYRQEAQVNRAVADLSTALLAEELSPAEVAATVLAAARDVTGSTLGFAGSVDADTCAFVGQPMPAVEDSGCPLEPEGLGRMLPVDSDGRYPSLCGHALNTRQGFFDNAPGARPGARELPAGHLAIERFLAVPVLHGDEVVGLVALANPGRDYTERDLRAVEQLAPLYALALRRQRRAWEREELQKQLLQSQKMEAVGQLAGGVAHDFNNLLMVISGNSELVRERLEPDSPLRGRVEEAVKAADRAAGLTRQLLAFSRRQVLEPRVLDLTRVVADLEKMLRRLIGEDVELVTQLAPHLSPVRADPGQLEQVVMNLAVNARDAMPTGGTLTLATADAELDAAYASHHGASVPPGHYVCLTVADSGSGMDRATATRIFEPFFTTKELGRGTGLGLSTVYGIVKQSDGFLWVYSEPGAGTTFRVYLPRHEGAAGSNRPESVAAAVGGIETLLLVEDEPGVRDIVARQLGSLGYRVLEAGSPQEALGVAQAHSGPIDLLVSDVVMPGMGGRVFADQLRETYPRVPVLYMSGYTDDALVRHGISVADCHFLQKPFSRHDLARKVREALAPPPEAAGG